MREKLRLQWEDMQRKIKEEEVKIVTILVTLLILVLILARLR